MHRELWKSGAIRCHWKTGVIRGLKLVLFSCFGPLPCSWNGGDDLRESDTRGRLPALHRRTDQNCSLVLRLGSHQLRQVDTQFRKGNFVVKKTKHVFSGIAIVQAHEQNNSSVKGDGGAVGLTDNPAALRHWMVSGPEMACLIGEFEVSTKKRIKQISGITSRGNMRR